MAFTMACGNSCITVGEYLTEKFGSLGHTVTSADILDISLLAGVSADDEYTGDNKELVGMAVCQFIPQLVARPQSVSESGFSVSWDKDSLLRWYSLLCKRYGLTDELSDTPRISFL